MDLVNGMETMIQAGLDKALKELIDEYSIKLEDICLTDSLWKDHGIYGDDIDEFFNQYAKLFKVDLSNFDSNMYFPEEGNSTIINVVLWLFGKYIKPTYKLFTIQDLVDGVDNGYLK